MFFFFFFLYNRTEPISKRNLRRSKCRCEFSAIRLTVNERQKNETKRQCDWTHVMYLPCWYDDDACWGKRDASGGIEKRLFCNGQVVFDGTRVPVRLLIVPTTRGFQKTRARTTRERDRRQNTVYDSRVSIVDGGRSIHARRVIVVKRRFL